MSVHVKVEGGNCTIYTPATHGSNPKQTGMNGNEMQLSFTERSFAHPMHGHEGKNKHGH